MQQHAALQACQSCCQRDEQHHALHEAPLLRVFIHPPQPVLHDVAFSSTRRACCLLRCVPFCSSSSRTWPSRPTSAAASETSSTTRKTTPLLGIFVYPPQLIWAPHTLLTKGSLVHLASSRQRSKPCGYVCTWLPTIACLLRKGLHFAL